MHLILIIIVLVSIFSIVTLWCSDSKNKVSSDNEKETALVDVKSVVGDAQSNLYGPKETIKTYFQALENKDEKLLESVTTENRRGGLDVIDSIKLLEIGERRESEEKYYMTCGRGSITTPDEFQIFNIVYDIEYKKDKEYPAAEPDGKAYKIITVIKQNKNSAWLVDEVGNP